MDILSQLKRTAIWLSIALLLLSALVNYKLFGYASQLQSRNQVLSETVASQEVTNHQLAQRITDLTTQRAADQQAADESSQRERDARNELNERIEKLTKELSDETCSTVPVNYPADWVSGY